MAAPSYANIAIIGAGAAGLMAAVHAARANPALNVVALDGARSLGAKILVAGGGRCNVTHHHVDEAAFAGSSRNAIKKVLRRFDVPQTINFFQQLGVQLKREETGKLFPVTDRARTVLNALLTACRSAGVQIMHPWRVKAVAASTADGSNPPHFTITNDHGAQLHADRVILATGGMSLPKTGSDGHGYTLARSLGHSVTSRVLPALVPLTLPKDHFICRLSGLTLPATLDVRTATGKRLTSFTNSTLCTHFGLSGPCVLDISRYYLDAKFDDAGARLIINWLPEETVESIDAMLLGLGKVSPVKALSSMLPERLARELCREANIEPAAPAHQLRKDQRRALARACSEMELPITGNRGFGHAEVTAGGVPLAELHLNTMESRIQPRLHLCGELCDVDGRIGGFNFQWAWASGYVAGVSCATASPLSEP